MKLEDAAKLVQNFENSSLALKLADLEANFKGNNKQKCQNLCSTQNINLNLLKAAHELKKTAGQINVIIHAAGILTALPYILDDQETVESLSLGAGNTGRKFDLETNKRIAEFKFINWQGGPESIRQNSLFKDFFELAEHDASKKRELYVLDDEIPLKFFNGKRNLESVLSKNIKLAKEFRNKYGERFEVVCEYYEYKKNLVSIVNLTKIIPDFNVCLS